MSVDRYEHDGWKHRLWLDSDFHPPKQHRLPQCGGCFQFASTEILALVEHNMSFDTASTSCWFLPPAFKSPGVRVKMQLARSCFFSFFFTLGRHCRNIHGFLQHVKQIETVCGASRLYSTRRCRAAEEANICVPPHTSSEAQTLLAQRNVLTKWWGSGFFTGGEVLIRNPLRCQAHG